LAHSVANADLIAFLQALPEGRKRRGVRYPQWLLLLMAIHASIRSFGPLASRWAATALPV
jgi:hypothetical protein